MFLNYYNVSISKNELVENYLHFEKPYEENGVIRGADSITTCITGDEIFDYESFCLEPFVSKMIQNILNDKKIEEFIQSATGFNLNYSIPDIPTLL